jgi:hypothetical protein
VREYQSFTKRVTETTLEQNLLIHGISPASTFGRRGGAPFTRASISRMAQENNVITRALSLELFL